MALMLLIYRLCRWRTSLCLWQASTRVSSANQKRPRSAWRAELRHWKHRMLIWLISSTKKNGKCKAGMTHHWACLGWDEDVFNTPEFTQQN